ncbi:MAG: hypothetical protein GC129_02545 [Proteobacteria bacterium]|nr:hypothetical protein [Pseudomonadota bacterium]
MMDANDNAAVLGKVKGWFEAAVTSTAYATWRAEARTAWDFYDGNQWTAEEASKLAENGQAAIVINKIAAKVDNLAGGEVVGRTRVVYKSRSGDAQEEDAARVLTDLALYVAERGDQALEISNVFRAGLVAGIGWLDIGVQEAGEGAQIFARAEDEFSVVWDPMARRMDFADARFVARERWMDEGEVRGLFPDQADQVLVQLSGNGGLGAALYGIGRAGRGSEMGYFDQQRQLFRLVEVQYKDPARQWRVRLADGRLVTTFERKETKVPGAVVEEVNEVPRVMVAYFAGDVLLDNRPLSYRHNRFTLVPFVYKRQRKDGRPYGLVRATLDPQRELNKRRSKAMHLLSTAQVIADVDAVDDPNVLAREAARPDGIILKKSGKDLRIIRNTDLAVSQVNVMEQAGKDIQEAIGVFDESIGKQSNATSGVAIQQRQMAGSLNQMFAYDTLRLVKKQLGEQVLGLMRQFFTQEMVIHITDQFGAGRQIALNAPVLDEHGKAVKGEDGEVLRVPDLASAEFDVVVEEVRDVSSAREMEAQQLQLLVQAGVPVPPEVLVEASGVRNKEVILAALRASKQ